MTLLGLTPVLHHLSPAAELQTKPQHVPGTGSHPALPTPTPVSGKSATNNRLENQIPPGDLFIGIFNQGERATQKLTNKWPGTFF